MTDRQLFLKHIAQTSPAPLLLEIARAEGAFLYDHSGKSYLDFICGIGPSLLGHGHPKIKQAVKEQVDKYMHTLVYGEFVLSPQVRYAERLLNILPDSFDNVYFLNSGAEAVEAAMKLAKRYTGKRKIISAYNAYHGSTHGAMSLNSDRYFTDRYRPLLPEIEHIRFNDQKDLEKIDQRTAAVILEPIQAEGGILVPKENYLMHLRKRCDEVGALLIFDEIQTGFGRTGHMFAFEKYGVLPDAFTVAKGMGGGMPVSGLVTSKSKMEVFQHDPVLGHITTFGGHPVNCAAALATLNIIIDEDILDTLEEKIAYLESQLQHPNIKEVRKGGFWFAVDVGDESYLLDVVHECLRNGLIVDWFLFNTESIRIAPPLNISMENLALGVRILLNALDKIKKA